MPLAPLTVTVLAAAVSAAATTHAPHLLLPPHAPHLLLPPRGPRRALFWLEPYSNVTSVDDYLHIWAQWGGSHPGYVVAASSYALQHDGTLAPCDESSGVVGGTLWGSTMIQFGFPALRALNLTTLAMTYFTHDDGIAIVLADPQPFVDACVDAVQTHGLQGIDLDYEPQSVGRAVARLRAERGVGGEDPFFAFLALLGHAMESRGWALTVDATGGCGSIDCPAYVATPGLDHVNTMDTFNIATLADFQAAVSADNAPLKGRWAPGFEPHTAGQAVYEASLQYAATSGVMAIATWEVHECNIGPQPQWLFDAVDAFLDAPQPVFGPVGGVSLTFDPAAPTGLFTVWPTYLSLNIDTASLTNSMDFSDAALIALAQQVVSSGGPGAALQLRIGGGTADAACYTGPAGPAGNCTFSPTCTTCINDAYLDQIAGFQRATGVALVWDFNAIDRTPDNAWDPSNARAMLARITSQGIQLTGVQLGNEPELWVRRNITVNGTQLGLDVLALSALLAAAYPPPAAVPMILGPSACCDKTPGFLSDYLAAAAARAPLSALDFHVYPIGRSGANKSCELDNYFNVSAWGGLDAQISQYARVRDAGPVPTLPLVLGETATSADGGCAGYSNRFISGGEFLYTLGRAAELGVSQVNRQDLVGFSGPTEPSNYALAGLPGWTSGSAALASNVHPDYFTAVLWKQTVGDVVLSSTLAGDDSALVQVVGKVWCSRGGGGSVTVVFVNYNPEGVALGVVGVPTGTPRVEYVLTSVSDPWGAPPSLNSDTVYLNGAALSVDPGTGRLPTMPIPGKAVPASGPGVVMPAWSYGFLVFPQAGALACQ